MKLQALEAELSALASSNQQVRSQLEASGQQLATAHQERRAAQEAGEAQRRRLATLQQEVEVLKGAADVEAALRRELEALNEEVRAARARQPAGGVLVVTCAARA
jgi:chromosome segregation ATPase